MNKDIKELICICCPKGCHILVKNNEFSNYSCLRGLNYAKKELISPERTITSTIKIKNPKDLLVVPVKTSSPVPKDKMFDIMKEINKIEVSLPIKMNQIIIKNVLNLNVDIIATKEID